METIMLRMAECCQLLFLICLLLNSNGRRWQLHLFLVLMLLLFRLTIFFMSLLDIAPLTTGCVVFKDRLYVIGGQEGDFMAKPGAPIFKCSRRNEVVFGNVYMLDDEVKWKTLPPMLKPDSHIEFAWAIVSNYIVIVGGTTEKHPVTKKMVLVGEIFQFNFDTLWSVIRELPYRVKTTLVGYWQGWLYFISGQRDKGPTDPAQKKVIGEMWRTKLKLNS
ncbi:hypothetical protein V6Z11_A05G121300 [Gossypium hirsutum]